jgi:uncharacterized membrane protein HdeD (DUF308 family)
VRRILEEPVRFSWKNFLTRLALGVCLAVVGVLIAGNVSIVAGVTVAVIGVLIVPGIGTYSTRLSR